MRGSEEDIVDAPKGAREAGPVKVPFLRILIGRGERGALAKVLRGGRFARGPLVREFEDRFAVYCGAKRGIATNSGSSALYLALKALRLRRGDEVIVPNLTFVATAMEVINAGLRPVLVDVEGESYCMSVDQVKRALSPRTKAIMPVHLYGQPCDVDPLMELAEERGLYVIEDASQAHGAEYKGRKTGSLGHLACFSFYPSKNMTVLGEGGMVVTNDEELAERVAMLRDHGRADSELHIMVGHNFRMGEFQAAVGLVQLDRLDEANERRRRRAMLYNELLQDGVKLPLEMPYAKHVYHLYVIRSPRRDALMEELRRRGIEVAIHYPRPLHKQPFIKGLAKRGGSLRVSDQCCKQVLSLPMHPLLKRGEQEYVARAIRDFLSSG